MHRRSFLTSKAGLGVVTLAARTATAANWPVPDWENGTLDPNRMTAAGLDALRAYLQEKGTRSALVIRNG